MNWQSWLVLAIVAVAVVGALYIRLRKPRRRKGDAGCSGNCSSCH
ncbi:MAG: FeoB-associated Cys-rich membrane protein [Alloprevotella sp.]|nr:FeoB-associated Cys-rich membrane protein [Alloprevotella sp.]